MKGLSTATLSLASFVVASTAVASPNAYLSTPFANQVLVVDTADNSLVTTIDVGEFPRGLKVSPDGSKVYVANIGDNADPMNILPSTISVIQTDDNSVTTIETDPTGVAGTSFVAFTPDGAHAYASNQGSDEVIVIDVATDSLAGTSIPTGGRPQGLEVNHAGTRLYVANQTDGTVTVIDTSNNQVVTTIPVGGGSAQVAVSPDDKKVYVTSLNDGTVWVINADTNAVIGSPLDLGSGSVPYGMVFSEDGSQLFVLEHIGDEISVIDTATDTVGTPVPLPAIGPFLGARNAANGLIYFTGSNLNTFNPANLQVVSPALDTTADYTFGIDIVGSDEDNGGNNNGGGGGGGGVPAGLGNLGGGGGCSFGLAGDSAPLFSSLIWFIPLALVPLRRKLFGVK
ncbi:MAG: YncE family protein [bacterium]